MTIEERGATYAEVQCKGCQKQEKVGRYHGYLQGAADQREIDIKNAMACLRNAGISGSLLEMVSGAIRNGV